MLELPLWTCHKQVRAAKIENIMGLKDGEAMLFFAAAQQVRVTKAFFVKHAPHAGGYFVVYDDNYQSFSPAEPFEAGYTRIEG